MKDTQDTRVDIGIADADFNFAEGTNADVVYEEESFEVKEQKLKTMSRNAMMTLWFSMGTVFCMLIGCLTAPFINEWNEDLAFLGIMAALTSIPLLLTATLLLYFLLAKKKEVWYTVCSLINRAAVVLLSVVLAFAMLSEIRVLYSVLGTVSVAVFTAGIILLYSSSLNVNKVRILYTGIVVLAVVFCASVILYTVYLMDFWFFAACCALVCGADLYALAWTNKEWPCKPLAKALAISSFAVFVFLLIVLIVLIILYLTHSDKDSDSKSSSGSSSSKKSKKESKNRDNDRYSSNLYYYTPALTVSRRLFKRSSLGEEQAGIVSEEEKKRGISKYRMRRILLTSAFALGTAAVFVVSIIFSYVTL